MPWTESDRSSWLSKAYLDHGKTELAKQMGALLGTDLCNINMTKISTAWDLHGPHPGYVNTNRGPALNNFPAEHDKRSCVVFLDEFGKTEKRVHESLLTIMDSGISKDSRTGSPLDVFRSVWILASNKGSDEISNFYENHMESKKYCFQEISIRLLQKELTRLFVQLYTKPAVTGRITTFVPFLPFSENEAAVVIHKFPRSFSNDLRLPTDTHSEKPRLTGHIDLNIVEDGPLCSFLAKDCYNRDLGSKSLRSCVDGLEDQLVMEDALSDEEVSEAVNGGPLIRYTMQLRTSDDEQEVEIFKDGGTCVQSEDGRRSTMEEEL